MLISRYVKTHDPVNIRQLKQLVMEDLNRIVLCTAVVMTPFERIVVIIDIFNSLLLLSLSLALSSKLPIGILLE